MNPATSVHRALSDERRTRLVEELRSAPEGLDVQELAGRLGLHPNTVRWHLGILVDAGLVDSHPAARSVPGRPRVHYSLRAERAAPAGDEYRLLATILAGTMAAVADGPSRAEAAGRAWGRYLVKRPAPLTVTSEEAAVGELVNLLDQQGFQPQAGARQIRMHRCPFRELAEERPDIVCAVHAGLISGALAELESGLDLEDLEIFPEPDVCIARLAPSR